MGIGIIGSGEMGKTLGQLWTLKGHKVLFGSRNPERVNEWIKTNNIKARSGTYNKASNYGKIVLLATNWADIKNALGVVNSLSGKILIDCTIPEGKLSSTVKTALIYCLYQTFWSILYRVRSTLLHANPQRQLSFA